MQQTIKMPPQGNKWGEESVIEILIDIERDAVETDVLFLGRSLTKMGLYPQLWSYWRKVYSHNEVIMARMMRINCIFEGKLYEGALRKQLSVYMTLSALKRNHHWNEEPERDDTGRGASPVFIRMDADTLQVVDTPENAGLYVKVKEEDKSTAPDLEPAQQENPKPEVQEKTQSLNSTTGRPDNGKFISPLPAACDLIWEDEAQDNTELRSVQDPVPEGQNKISYTSHY